jgi:hypothetical protein
LYAWGGPQLLAITFAALQTITVALWHLVLFQLVGKWYTLFGAIAVALLNAPQLDGLSGPVLGQCCLAILFAILLSTRSQTDNQLEWSGASKWQWIGVAALFVAWANCDLSVVCGAGVLLLLVVERLTRVTIAQGFRALVSDRELQSRVWLLELAIVATFIHPEGLSWWQSLLWWPDNTLVRAMGGFASPTFASWIGASVLVSWAVWFAAARRHREIPLLWILLPASVTVATVIWQTAILWFVPVMAASIAALVGRQPVQEPDRTPAELISPHGRAPQAEGAIRFSFTLLTALVLWLGFCFSPLGSVLGGKPRDTAELLGDALPLGAQRFLEQQSATLFVLAPTHWTDFLLANTDCQFYATRDVSRIPHIAVRDSQRILSGGNDWNTVAKKYALGCIVIDKQKNQGLMRAIRRGVSDWKIAYEDSTSVIVVLSQVESHRVSSAS